MLNRSQILNGHVCCFCGIYHEGNKILPENHNCKEMKEVVKHTRYLKEIGDM